MRRERIFVGFGNVFSSIGSIDSTAEKRINAILGEIGARLCEIDATFLFAGRKDSMAYLTLKNMAEIKGGEWAKGHIRTYLPDRYLKNEISKDSYAELGRVLVKGDWIEQRRELILHDSDLMLLSRGRRGSNHYPTLARDRNMFVLPLPMGKGSIQDLYHAFYSRFENSLIAEEALTIGDSSASPSEIADAYVCIVSAIMMKK